MVLVACFGQGVGVHRGENQEKKGCWWKGDEGPRSHNPFRELHGESLVGFVPFTLLSSGAKKIWKASPGLEIGL